MTVQVRITPAGRMSLPASIRKRLGLSNGGSVLIEETDDGIIMRTASQAVSHAQALARKYTEGKEDASVASFLANRREESGE